MRKCLRAMPLVMLVLTLTLIGGPAWSEDLHAKPNKELTALGQKIDRAAAPADASLVTARIVDEWSGTKFVFDRTSPSRSLTVQDVQNLRATGLGYGEIAILLGLSAKQPNPLTAKPVTEILALRQSGIGWGELARELGYRKLGSVVQSVKTTEKDVVRLARPVSPEEQRRAARLQAEATQLNAKATAASSTPEGTQRVVSVLAKTFKVPEGTVITLREQHKLGFGETTIVLGLAQELAKRDKISLPVAIDQVITQHAAGAGWGQIAHAQDLKLGQVVSEVEKVDKGLGAIQKPDRVEPAKTEKPEVGRFEKPSKSESPEKIDKPEKLERVEKLEKPAQPERLEKVERLEKPARVERPERVERPGRR